MAFFNKKESSVVGIDLGSTSIKIVELKRSNNQPQLVTYGVALKDHTAAENSSLEGIEKSVANLKEIINKARVTTNKTISALPATSVFSTIIELPNMPKKEINSAIHWEAKKFVPLPLEKISLDWDILPVPASSNQDEKKENKSIKVFLTAAPKEIINKHLEIFRQADLELIGLETEITALRRSLVPNQAGIFMIIDIGATNTNMIIFSNNIPLATRSINVGTKIIDVNIANTMNINEERAEKFRNDFGLPAGRQFSHPVTKAVQFVFDNMIIKEIKNLITSFQGPDQTPPDKIILTGGCAHLKNLPAYLKNIFQIETIIGNPWQKVRHPEELSPELEKIGPQMAVAVGLALKETK